jgi:hypothetical protein
MLRIVLAVAIFFFAGRVTRRIMAPGLVILAGVVIVAVMSAVVMTTVPTASAMIIRRSATGGMVMRPLGMSGTIAMIVQRRRDCIGEQIARQHDPDRDFPKNGH